MTNVTLEECKQMVEDLIVVILTNDLDYRGTSGAPLPPTTSLSEFVENRGKKLLAFIEDEDFPKYMSCYADNYNLSEIPGLTGVEYEEELCAEHFMNELFPTLDVLHGDSMDYMQLTFVKKLFNLLERKSE